jgi:hypothetical protein
MMKLAKPALLLILASVALVAWGQLNVGEQQPEASRALQYEHGGQL